MVQGSNRARFPYCNGFLIDGPDTVLIDAGAGERVIRDIDRITRIDVLIVSHSHPDHILRWDRLEDRRLILPKETPESVHDLAELGRRFAGSPEGGRVWTRFARNGLKIKALREPDERFADSRVFRFGDVRLRAVHSPGHVKDHYCFFEETSNILLTTDVDFSSFGPWYGNPEGDIERFMADIERLRRLPASIVCSSHKPPFRESIDARFQKFLNAFERQRRIVFDLCDPPKTSGEMISASPFYQNRLHNLDLQHVFEGNMIRKNLDLLVRDGLVGEDNGRYFQNESYRFS